MGLSYACSMAEGGSEGQRETKKFTVGERNKPFFSVQTGIDPMTTSSIVWCHSPIRAKMPAVLPVTAFCKCHPVKNASNFFVLLLLQEF